ncbi:N,N-dimethylformamidase beta subunit family domain-containing protein [Achromobacter aegrifaciens]|uniref:N,N-dimethylformamidase n=1 Tax=Achromobacter aegrifaciens TaxID=1287736 RepID=A0ABU2DMD7_ACHAE|nr:N,N-dimethylformamidase beta subunit family domain-containing protein [Achromobacter aegrifaciens]MDR7949299.1 N,N-dimethylformamidase [Achromobacter aegrifaciens]
MYEILGYPSTWTIAPGETIEFKVSCAQALRYDADLVRIRSGDVSPGAPGLKETVVLSGIATGIAGRPQGTETGSRAVAPAFSEPVSGCKSWILAVMPTLPCNGGDQAILSRWDEAAHVGYALGLDRDGRLFWEQGSGGKSERLTLALPMAARQWYLVAVNMDLDAGTVALRQTPTNPLLAVDSHAQASGRLTAVDPAALASLPLTMGAAATGKPFPRYARHYNGRLDSPTLLPYAAGDADLAQLRVEAAARRHAAPPLAAWDFSQRIDTDVIVDAARPWSEGRIENLPARGVPGLRWDSSVMFWRERPDHFAALHFHDDTLEDAGWETDFSLAVPDDLPSGLYAARLTGAAGEQERITFIVRPKAGGPRKRIAFLASTATYMAYSNSHYRLDEEGMEMKSGNFMVLYPWETYLGEHRELGLSMYDTHSDGYGVYYASRLRPVFSMHLQCRTWSLNGDTHFLDWLDEKGFDYDVITDDMLHAEGLQALDGYKVVMTGAHPEYWTTRMWQAMVAYQGQGGRLMYMGGNGFYWRCAYHPEKPWLMELRRTETGARYSETPAGESYHSYTGEYGGTWRRIGIAPQTLTGIGTTATGFDASSYYRRRPESHDPRVAFMFDGVEDEIIGDFGSSGGGAAGDEIDRVDYRLGTPPHTLIVARSEKHTRYYNVVPEETTYHHPTINGEEAKHCYADLVFYECLNGGAVFSTGSITWGASLAWNGYDNNVSRITANVLARFADATPFVFPQASGR